MTMFHASDSSLLTDFYELTMAQGYWASDLAERPATFHLYVREAPQDHTRFIAAGLASALDWLEGLAFTEEVVAFLAATRNPAGTPIFQPDFLTWLSGQRLSLDIDAVREGELVTPPTPLLRVSGPLWQAQFVESALLNIINFQSLIATRAAAVCAAAAGGEVLEFGMRRAQGPDGALSASRAAYIGGCAGTSNVLAAKRFGIPLKGTHAHSWVMAFEDEEEAFRRYAMALPDPCVLLVDTYDTERGVERAIRIGKELAQQGRTLAGIRLDSGDLAELARLSRQKLDEAGLHETRIVASNDLDEARIRELVEAGAPIDIWGVGTRMVTSRGASALGGVYKLSSLQDEDGRWRPRIKASETREKASFPGRLQAYRVEQEGSCHACVLADVDEEGVGSHSAISLSGDRIPLPAEAQWVALLQPVMRHGQRVGAPEALSVIRERAAAAWGRYEAGEEPRFGLTPALFRTRETMLDGAFSEASAMSAPRKDRGK